MADVTNKQIAKAFRNALPFLWNGRGEFTRELRLQEYICHAIRRGVRSQGYGFEMSSAADTARYIIQSRLTIGKYTMPMDDWLHETGVPCSELTEPRVQAHRKAWLKMLIKEFENKKD